MDAAEFLDKWNKICAYVVDVNNMPCRKCELDDICGKICSKPGEVTKEECEEFVKKVNEMYEKKNKLWMFGFLYDDVIKEKTEQWTKEAKEAGMTLTEYLESISPLNHKEDDQNENSN